VCHTNDKHGPGEARQDNEQCMILTRSRGYVWDGEQDDEDAIPNGKTQPQKRLNGRVNRRRRLRIDELEYQGVDEHFSTAHEEVLRDLPTYAYFVARVAEIGRIELSLQHGGGRDTQYSRY